MANTVDRSVTIIYDLLRAVPDEAKKPIAAGRLKGFTDINPMWRIKRMTEVFGPCGIGWWYEVTGKRLEGQGDEIRAFVDVNLYYKWMGETSQPIPGTGGASFLTKEKNGAYTSDECYKMALTDALSVAMKALGMAADVYYDKDRDKYTAVEPEKKPESIPDYSNKEPATVTVMPPKPAEIEGPKPQIGVDGYYHCQDCGKIIKHFLKNNGDTIKPEEIAARTLKKYGRQLCSDCGAKYK